MTTQICQRLIGSDTELGLAVGDHGLLDQLFKYCYADVMGRPKQFDPEDALDAAIALFREHGYAGTSADMLIESMQIGKQSLYNTFGGKWQLYVAALARYATAETSHHMAALRGGPTAFGGIERMMKRVVAEAQQPCLGVNSVSEFGCTKDDLTEIRETVGRPLHALLVSKILEAQKNGDVSPTLNPEHGAAFLRANVTAIRVAARAGAGEAELRGVMRLALQALK
ncbi:TetR/AcrR family transcriptional regulator [Ottowia thiooxydans]